VKLDELEQHKLKLESAIASTSAAAPRLHPNLAEIYRKKVDNLQEALSDPETRSEAIEILRGLIERVAVSAAEEGFTIELVGEIANMVGLSSGSEGRKVGPYRSSVKVVAAVGFEPTNLQVMRATATKLKALI
jgi:site-specific DNA recombinase